MNFKPVVYLIFIFLIYNLTVQYAYAYKLPFFSEKLYKHGFIKKQPFHINIGYEYNNSNGFDILYSNNSNSNVFVTSKSIEKSSHGIKAEADLYITPFLKFYINYIYRQSDLAINYEINKNQNKFLLTDYSSKYAVKTDEHIYMAGFELSYEWTIKNKYSPYISFLSGFGLTAVNRYDDIFYNAQFMLKAGTYITFNENLRLNVYTGADYTTLFNSGIMQETFTINIPKNYLSLNTPNGQYETSVIYYENYDKNINMVLGAKLEIYKYSSIFAEIKYINSLTIYTGINIIF